MPLFILRVRLFISSYALLFLLLAIRFTNLYLVAACLALAAFGFLTAYWVLREARKPTGSPYTIKAVHDAGHQVSGYLVSYILPFVTAAEPSGREILVYLMYLVVVGLIYVQSEMIQLNPTFYLLGLRIGEIEVEEAPAPWRAYVVSGGTVAPGDSIRATSLADRFLVVHEGPASA